MRNAVVTLVVTFAACSSAPEAGRDAGADAGWVNLDGGIPTGDCERDHMIIANETYRLIQAHAGPCTLDSDCTVVERSVSCSSYCPAAVLADGGAELRAEIVAYGEAVCPYVACVGAGLCRSYEMAICHEGICRLGFSDGGLAD